MNNNQLDYFALAYEQGSCTLAARIIPLTPQAVNKSIKALERELGRKLFEEDTFKPTPYADALYAYALDMKKRRSALMAEFLKIDAAQSGIIRIGAAMGVLDILGASVFENYKRTHAGLDFTVDEIADQRCDEDLLAGLYDLAFTVAPYNKELKTVEIQSMPLSMWVNKSSPLAKAGKVALEDLSSHKLATPIKGAKNTQRIIRLCQDRNITPKRIVNLQQMYRIYEFVLHNKGIGTNVGVLLKSELFSNDNVVSVPFEDFTFSFGISWPKDHNLTDAESDFVSYVIASKNHFPID